MLEFIYYAFVFLFVIMEVRYIFNCRREIELSKLVEEKGKIDYHLQDEETKRAVRTFLYRFGVVFVVLFLGLLTSSWPLVLLLLVTSIALAKPFKWLRKHKPEVHVIAIWLNSIFGLAIGLVLLLNYVHIGLNFSEIVQNFF
ncbi:MAG: hypothetical protein GY827_04895 [Cytophagales bacterium]|nr:hypothetical protein [Cytophagales bacterium]